MFTDDLRGDASATRSTGHWVTIAIAVFAVSMVALQVAGAVIGFRGPLFSLITDYVATPSAATVCWVGLGMSLVGLPNRWRIGATCVAVGIDAVLATARVMHGGGLIFGNGPLIVLTGLMLLVWLWWPASRTPTQRSTALRGIALGVLLILATKVGNTWLDITAIKLPTVLDKYALLADHALAQPAWLMGRIVEAGGPLPSAVLHVIYGYLGAAAMVVTAYQLRNVTSGGWPRHFLVRTFLILGLVGPLLYLVFPLVGPEFAFAADGQGFQAGDYWPHTLPPVDFVPAAIPFDHSTPRNCMPSMHAAWALAVFIHSRHGPRWLRWGGTIWLVGTVVATLGFGYHYGVDLLVGAALCLTIEAALREPERGWGSWRVRVVAAGTALLTGMLLCFRYLAVEMAHMPLLFGPLVIGSTVLFGLAYYAAFHGRSQLTLRDRLTLNQVALQDNQPQTEA